MKYFLIEGTVINPEKITDTIMNKHKEHTEALMKENKVLLSSLKKDMSSSISIVKYISEEEIKEFYNKDPLLANDIIEYKISKLDIHYISNITNWFEKN